MKAPKETNDARKFFVTPEMTAQLLAACPDLEWRAIIALSRYAGLRCPSETLAITWADVDWEQGRMRVDSVKTGVRVVPLFPELREILSELFDAAEDGTVHVITRYRDTRQNLRTQFLRIIRRAGLSPWERPFHNLRASRETE